MEFIKKNRVLLFFCLTSIITIILIILLSKKTDDNKSEYKESYSYLHNYKVNEVVPVYVSDKDIAIKYLSNYITLLINDPLRAYNLLDDNYKKNKFGNYEAFTYYIKDLLTMNFIECNVTKYSVTKDGNYKYIRIVDGDNNHITFKEKTIMNYEVFLDDYIVK